MLEYGRIYKGFTTSLYSDRKNQEKMLERTEVDSLVEYYGVLNDDIVLVDVDNVEQGGVLLKILIYMNITTVVYKTRRGYHFLFYVPDHYSDKLKSFTNQNTALGIKVDYKLGKNNDCERLKRDGVEYEIVSDDDVAELPYFLLPVSSPQNELWLMQEGDSRNDTLLRYEWNLYRVGISVDQIKELFSLINNYIFRDKLSDKEIDSITRPEAIKKVVESCLMVGKNPDVKTISELMIENDNVININDQLYIYTDVGMYTNNIRVIEKRILDYIPNLKTSPRNEVIRFLNINAPPKEFSDQRFILFRNCVYDSETNTLLQPKSSFIIPNQINWCYDPDAYDENVERFLYSISCDNEQVIDLLEEMMGYCFLRSNLYRKMFILTGNKRNGKSTFLKCVEHMLGENNVSTIGLESISKRFINTTLMNKLANIGDDIESNNIMYTADLKKLISGETIAAEKKGENPIKFKNYAKLIFSANRIPHIQDDTGAVLDRMVIIPFNAYYDENNCDPFLINKLTTKSAIECFIAHGIDGLKRLLSRNCFTIPKCVSDSLTKYLLESNPMRAFIEENRDNIIGKTNGEVFRNFEIFCHKNDITMRGIQTNTLTRVINKELGYTCGTNNGKRVFKYK